MRVLRIRECGDETVTIIFELNKFDRKVIRRVLKVKKLTKKRIEDFITKALLTYIGKVGGEE